MPYNAITVLIDLCNDVKLGTFFLLFQVLQSTMQSYLVYHEEGSKCKHSFTATWRFVCCWQCV